MMKRNLLALALAATPATAHIVLMPDRTSAGAYYSGALRVGHGCDGAATTAVRVEIPETITDAKPQPKPGWTVEIERDLRKRVAAIVWRGRLPVDQFDTFGVMMKLPKGATGPMYLPTVQTCEKGERRWTQIPAAGAPWASVKAPAPVLNIEPIRPPAAPRR